MPNDTPMYDAPANDKPADDAGPRDAAQAGDSKEETPASELDRLNEELKKKQEGQVKTAQEIERLKSEIEELGKAVAEIDKKARDWETASKKIKEQKDAQQSFFDRERKELEATLPLYQQRVVKDAKKKGEDEVDRLRDDAGKLTGEVEKKRLALAEAEKKKSAAEQKYKAVLNLAEADNALLKELTTIHADADAEEKKNNTLRQYFLILEGEDALGKIDVPDVKAYTARLNAAASAASDAADAERVAKDDLANAQVALQTAQKKLGDAEKNRRQKTRAEIPENQAEAAQG